MGLVCSTHWQAARLGGKRSLRRPSRRWIL